MKYTKEQKKELESRGKLVGDGFFISYVVAGSGPTGDETALVKDNKTKPSNFYILNGDWRKEYKPLIKKGYKECKKFFESKKKEHINFWSE